MKSALSRLREHIDQLSLRERMLLFVATLVVLSVIGANLLLAPLWNEQDRLRKELAQQREQSQKLETQLHSLALTANVDLDAENRARLAVLQQQLGTIDAALAEKTAGLVSPQEMARLVEAILKQNRKLELIKVENLAATPLGEEAEEPQQGKRVARQPAKKPEYVIYRHGMRIEFKGRYLDIVDYLKTLERLPWKVFWGEAVLESVEYPVSRFSLVLYTLSLDEGWIGV